MWLREVELNLMMTEVCGPTNYIVMEVGWSYTSGIIKVYGVLK